MAGHNRLINSPWRIRSLQTGGSTDGLFCMIRSVDIIIMTISQEEEEEEILFLKKMYYFIPRRDIMQIFSTQWEKHRVKIDRLS